MEIIERTEKERGYDTKKWETAAKAAVERYFEEIGTISQEQLDELIKAALTRKIAERYNTAPKKSAVADGTESIPVRLKDFLVSQREDLTALTARILATLEGHPERMSAATKALRGRGDDMRAYLAKFKDED